MFWTILTLYLNYLFLLFDNVKKNDTEVFAKYLLLRMLFRNLKQCFAVHREYTML